MRFTVDRSPPSGPAASLDELQEWTRTEGMDEVLFQLQMMGDTAAAQIEHHAQIALLTQTVVVTFEAWPDDHRLTLPIGPVHRGAPIIAKGSDGMVLTTHDARFGARASFRLDAAEWTEGPLTVEYDAGFGTTPRAIPADLRAAICAQVGLLFDLRQAQVGEDTGLSAHAARVAARYRGVRL